MIISITILAIFSAAFLVQFFFYPVHYAPAYLPDSTDSKVFDQGYFTVTHYYKKGKRCGVKVESSKLSFPILAKIPYDPENEIEFYKVSISGDLENLGFSYEKGIRDYSLTQFIQAKSNSLARKEALESGTNPNFLRIGEQVSY